MSTSRYRIRTASLSLLLPLLSTIAAATTYTVTNTADSGPGSLRQAILDANANPGLDAIAFNIPGPGVHTIAPTIDLPTLTDDAGVTIDGFTQPGASPNTLAVGSDAVILIEIQGTGTVGAQGGFLLDGRQATIRGMAINRFRGLGVGISGGYGHRISGCYIGTDPTGTAAVPNGFGISIVFQSAGPTGSNLPDTVIVGGPDPSDRNVISGNVDGAFHGEGVTASVFQNNYIGVDASGSAAVPNRDGFECFGCSLTIGRDNPFAPGPHAVNVISGNLGEAVGLAYGAQSVIAGNYIGTDATGATALPNGSGVVLLFETADLVEDNVIAGNRGPGVNLYTTTVSGVLNNHIGVDLSGSGALGNTLGVRVVGHSVRNVIESNTIAFNSGSGVAIGDRAQDLPSEITVQTNALHDNKRFGIDLGSDGVTYNNACDSGRGPNLGQNFPVLTAVATDAATATTTITGTLNSVPNSPFVVELFSSSTCDPSGYGEGAKHVGWISVTTDAACGASFTATLPVALVEGEFVTATATDGTGNTSEFSACVIVGPTLVVTSVAPTSGPASGAAGVEVSGSNFDPGAAVTVGGVPAESIAVDRASHLSMSVPPLAPGALYPITVANPGGGTATLTNGWLADFLDVGGGSPLHAFVEKLVRDGVTSGCGSGNFCPDDAVTRAQMSVFLLRGEHGPIYTPPAASGTVFADVTTGSFAAAWIERLFAENITGGCAMSPLRFCPDSPVTRAQMAVLLLRAEHGPSYVPPPAGGAVFADVPANAFAAAWIEQLYAEGVTGGCGTNPLQYCPDADVTRGQMAVFLTATFSLS